MAQSVPNEAPGQTPVGEIRDACARGVGVVCVRRWRRGVCRFERAMGQKLAQRRRIITRLAS